MPLDLKEQIEATASANGRSMNAEILERLIQSFTDGTLDNGERREFQRRIDLLLDNEARLKDTLTRAVTALDKGDIQKARELLIGGAWFEPQREAPESTAADEDH